MWTEVQQRKNAFSLGLLLFFLNHFFLPLSFLLVLILYYLCSFLFFSAEKVFSVAKNRSREKLLIFGEGCQPVINTVFASSFFAAFDVTRSTLHCFSIGKGINCQCPVKKTTTKKTHTHTLEASAHCSHIMWTQYFGWHDLTMLDLTANFQHQPMRKLTLSQQTNKLNKLMTFSPNNYYLSFKMIS